jgi:hypothetical protein
MMYRCFLLLCIFSFPLFAKVTFIRDPFLPFDPSSVVRSSSDLALVIPVVKLQGIIEGPSKIYAVILFRGEKKVVGRGARLAEYTVDRVSSHKLWLKGPDKTLILTVGEEARL